MRVGIARTSSHNNILKPHELPLFGIGERDLLGMAGVDVERRIFVGCRGWRALGLEAWPNVNRVVGWGVHPPPPSSRREFFRAWQGGWARQKLLQHVAATPATKAQAGSLCWVYGCRARPWLCAPHTRSHIPWRMCSLTVPSNQLFFCSQCCCCVVVLDAISAGTHLVHDEDAHDKNIICVQPHMMLIQNLAMAIKNNYSMLI
jgi:hypothetical protein